MTYFTERGRGYPVEQVRRAVPTLGSPLNGNQAIAPSAGTLYQWTNKIIKARQAIDLTNASQLTNLVADVGTFLMINNGSSSTAIMEIRFTNQEGIQSDWFEVRRGFQIGGMPFLKVDGRWAAQSGETLSLIYAQDFLNDAIQF